MIYSNRPNEFEPLNREELDAMLEAWQSDVYIEANRCSRHSARATATSARKPRRPGVAGDGFHDSHCGTGLRQG